MGSLSIWHWIVVIAVVLLLFGRGKISDLMGDVAQGIKSFKKGLQDDEKTAASRRSRSRRSITRGAVDGSPLRMSAARLSEPSAPNRSRVDVATGCGRTGEERRGAAPNLVGKYWGNIASRERNFSCSTSGGVNWSSSRLSR
jgi:sec-independent protein translocase protein TatA